MTKVKILSLAICIAVVGLTSSGAFAGTSISNDDDQSALYEYKLADVLPSIAGSLGDRLSSADTLLDADRTVAGWDAAGANDITVGRANVVDTGPWPPAAEADNTADPFEYRPASLALLGFSLVGIALGVLTRRIKGIAVDDHLPRRIVRATGHSRRSHPMGFPAGT